MDPIATTIKKCLDSYDLVISIFCEIRTLFIYFK